MKYLKYLIFLFTLGIVGCSSMGNVPPIGPTPLKASPSGQGVFIVGSTGSITNPVNNGSWALLPNGVIDAFYSGIWNPFSALVNCSGLPALIGDTTSSAGSCTTTTSGVQGNSLAPNRVTVNSTSLSLNLSTNLSQYLLLNSSISTFTLTGHPSDGNVVRFKVTQGAGAPFTINWPTAFQWGAAGAPILSTAANKADWAFCVYDGTTTNYGCGYMLTFTP